MGLTFLVFVVVCAAAAVAAHIISLKTTSLSVYRQAKRVWLIAVALGTCGVVLIFLAAAVAIDERETSRPATIYTTTPSANKDDDARLIEKKAAQKEQRAKHFAVRSDEGNRGEIIRTLWVHSVTPIGGGLSQVCAAPVSLKRVGTEECATADSSMRVAQGDSVYIREMPLVQADEDHFTDIRKVRIVITEGEVGRLMATGKFTFADRDSKK